MKLTVFIAAHIRCCVLGLHLHSASLSSPADLCVTGFEPFSLSCGNLFGDLCFPELPEDCRGRWESFVEETLMETNRRNTVDLVRTVMLCILQIGLLSSGVSLIKKK